MQKQAQEIQEFYGIPNLEARVLADEELRADLHARMQKNDPKEVKAVKQQYGREVKEWANQKLKSL